MGWHRGLLVAALAGWLLARVLLAPLRRTMGAVDELTNGNFETRLAGNRQDELGDLMQNVDRLAATLEDSRDARQRWLADVSHELRTPVTILSAEIEAVRDGIRELDPAQIDSFAQEVNRLQALIDDLFQLSWRTSVACATNSGQPI